MASLDKMEGEAVEGVILVAVLGILGLAIWFYYFANKFQPPDWTKMLAQLIKKMIDAFNGIDWKALVPMAGDFSSVGMPTTQAGTNTTGYDVITGTGDIGEQDYTDAANSGGSE
jgi:hypothetical protein